MKRTVVDAVFELTSKSVPRTGETLTVRLLPTTVATMVPPRKLNDGLLDGVVVGRVVAVVPGCEGRGGWFVVEVSGSGSGSAVVGCGFVPGLLGGGTGAVAGVGAGAGPASGLGAGGELGGVGLVPTIAGGASLSGGNGVDCRAGLANGVGAGALGALGVPGALGADGAVGSGTPAGFESGVEPDTAGFAPGARLVGDRFGSAASPSVARARGTGAETLISR